MRTKSKLRRRLRLPNFNTAPYPGSLPKKRRSSTISGEANSPGKFSKRTVNLVGSLDKSDAMLFSRLCGFGFTIAQNFDPLIFNTDHKIYSDAGIHFGGISHLESTGLIQFSVADYYRTGISQKGFVYASDTRFGLSSHKARKSINCLLDKFSLPKLVRNWRRSLEHNRERVSWIL